MVSNIFATRFRFQIAWIHVPSTVGQLTRRQNSRRFMGLGMTISEEPLREASGWLTAPVLHMDLGNSCFAILGADIWREDLKHDL
mmetsp:Transcript_30982/g.103230  ORF Transcript_30982/g.103230 Transcript_30982/m.103230 type:complete len:85 (-) Transcript_30982:288-542(-)